MNLNVDTYNLLMNLLGAFYQAMGRVRSALGEHPPSPPPLLTIRAGYAESPAWYMIQAAEFDPEPLTVQNLRVRDIYASPSLALALLDLLASEKWLSRRGEQYFLTSAGRDVVNQLKNRPLPYLAEFCPLNEKLIDEIESRLRRIIDASLAVPNPPGAWSLAHSRNRAPDDQESALIKIFHYLSDFNAFRDDAHMAAFMAHEPQGYIWEAFTFIADGNADSAETLFDQLAYRGYSTEDFEQALASLAERGWIEQDPQAEVYRLTATGSTIRTEVETKTDQFFYGPWSLFSRDETESLIVDLNQLKSALESG